MKKFRCNILAVVITALLGVFTANNASPAESLRIGGTGVGLGVMKILAEAYHKSQPDENIAVLPSLGSSGGINALLHGAVDIALSSRVLKKSESDGNIVAKEFARTPFVFVANRAVKKDGITIGELVDILKGDTIRWPDGSRIRPVMRPESDIGTKLLRRISAEIDQAMTQAMARKGMIRAITDQESADIVEKTPGTIATSTLAQVISENRNMRILPIEGIVPTVEGISDGVYPFFVRLYIVTPVNPGEKTKKFLDFVNSPDRLALLKRNGIQVVKRF